MKRIKIGDLVEIPTPRGLAYAQFTHRNRLMGALLRVLPGILNVRPQDLERIVREREIFVAFFPVQAALNQGIVRLVGNYSIPQRNAPFPLFRSPLEDVRTGEIIRWWLWDGDKEWPVDQLSEQESLLPIREILNDTALVEKILESAN